jgi:hypothetical protein
MCKSFHSRSWQKISRECTLPKDPPTLSEYSDTAKRDYTRCEWLPEYEYSQRRGVKLNPYIDVEWNRPERCRVRTELRKAAQDYNANGDSDWDFWNRQHRHNISWYW